MNRTSNIKQICHDRGIKILVHFTRIENLRRILGEGLLSRNTLERQLDQQPIFNDQNRLDNHREAICLSIGFPNYQMFYKCASENQSQWVVLLLDVKVLWELNCAFCQENAASNTVRNIPLKNRKSPDALNNMFKEYYRTISRQSLSIPSDYPTHPQAEVLVFTPIPVAYIKKVHFCEETTLKQWRSNNSEMDIGIFWADKKYFFPRFDWKVWQSDNSDDIPEVYPEPWISAAKEAEKQRQEQIAEEAERQRQKRAAEKARLAVEEAERQRQKQAAEKAERQRQERTFIAHVGYEPSPIRVNDKGETDLHIATKLNLPARTTFLITHGEEVNAKNKYGNTPLHIAATENAHQTAEVLLIHDAEVNAKNEYGSTSLHIAAYKNAYQTVKVLLIHDAEVNAKDKDGDTPLHNAALKNAYQTAAVLLNQGAHVNAKNKDGETPLHFARSNNALEVAKILQRYGGY